MPAYSAHGQYLLLVMFLEMIRNGVLKRPEEVGVEPHYLAKSWMVLKPSSAGKPPQECEPKDMRIVVGFDVLNKYIRSPLLSRYS